MNRKNRLHIGVVEFHVGFWTRVFLWLVGQKELACLPVDSFEFKDFDIEMEHDIDVELCKMQQTFGETVVGVLGEFAMEYLKPILDKYVADVTK